MGREEAGPGTTRGELKLCIGESIRVVGVSGAAPERMQREPIRRRRPRPVHWGRMKEPRPTRVLFVCLGNICRSPLGEALFRHHAEAAGLSERFEADSAGTAAYHVGEPPDPRSVETARRRGVPYTGRARRIERDDYYAFDHIVAMDRSNLADIEARRPDDATAKIHLLRTFDPDSGGDDVPDPYYGGPDGFDDVHDIVDRSTRALLRHLAHG